jgi:hypothetical protein
MDGLRQSLVDPSREGIKVGILCTEDHSAMGRTGIVEVAEVLAIVCEHGPAVGVREREHFLVWNSPTIQVRLSNRQYVMAKLPQYFDGRVGKVLVREEAGQWLGLLILSDLTVNLFEVTGDKSPGVDQVGRSERGERAQDLGFSQTEPPVLLQRPDRDSRSGDPRITTTDPSSRLDSRAEAG